MAKQNKNGFKVNDFKWRDIRTKYQQYCDDMYYEAMRERRAHGEPEIDKEQYLIDNEVFLTKHFNITLEE